MLGRIAPTWSAKLRLALDLILLWTVAWAARTGAGSSRMWASLVLLLAATWLVSGVALRHYDPWVRRSLADTCAMATVLVFATVTVLALLRLAFPGSLPPVERFLMLLWPAALLSCPIAELVKPAHDASTDDPVLIVGAGPLARATAEELTARRGAGAVAGCLWLRHEEGEEPGCVPLLGPASELQQVLSARPVGEVYLAAHPGEDTAAMQRAISTCETLGVGFALPAAGFRLARARPAHPGIAPDGYVHFVTVHARPAERALKRLMDIALSAAALWFLAPLLLGVALLVKLTSRGPIFFKQVRVGLNGRTFHMLKFRSMVVNAEALKAKLLRDNEQQGPVFKMKRDPRVTPVGRFIRKYSIDELPQLINVLRGDMSLVGPRPPVPSEVAHYEPWQRRRLSVRPGLTCIWQVSGRNQISFEEWMYLDMQYIDHWTLLEDLRLILRTVPVVLTGQGAC